MSEHDGATPTRRRWWLIIAAALVILILAAGLGSAIRSRESSSANPTPTTGTAVTPTAGASTDRLVVVAGEGGTRLAVDGKTPIGYPHTCEGAVAAATNYSSSASRMAWVGPPGDELLAQIADSDNRLDIYRAGQQAAKKMGITLEPHPEWGGFRLGRCSSFEADVDVWRCEVQRVDGKAQRSCVDLTTTVAWVDGDWKLRHYAIPAEPPSPEVSPDPVLGEAPLPAAARRRALTEAGNGWQEFANAPR